MLKGGVIMDVMNVEQARIAEEAGAISVMALERVPAMIRAEGGVARMANPKLIREIMAAVTIPVMAKARIGHFAEAQILQHLGVDFIDESEVLTPADETYHIDKHAFTTPFVCGARNLGEALRRIAEGAAMIRTKGEAGTGDVVHAVQHMRQIVARDQGPHRPRRPGTIQRRQGSRRALRTRPHGRKVRLAPRAQLLRRRHRHSRRRRSHDAARRRIIFVGSGIFMKERATPLDVALWSKDDAAVGLCTAKDVGTPRNPEERAEAVSRAKAIVIATTHFADAKIVADAAETVTGSMKGLAAAAIPEQDLMQTRGW